MKKILILMGRYLPGYKDGGPVRTMINLTEALGDEYDLRIVALDRDHGDTKPYDNIRYGEWLSVGKAKVQYVKPKGFTFKLLRKLICECDLVYTCGFYDDYGYKTLILNRLKKVYGKPVVVASMGSFSKGALSQKSLKKKIFINVFKLFGLFKNITWSVTSELEANDLKETISKKSKYIIAEDLPRLSIPGRETNEFDSNNLKVVFLSRICLHKNLVGVIDILFKTNVNISFTICGPVEDKEYWLRCKEKLNELPHNVKWKYKGNIPSEDVQFELLQHDVMILPTLGENFCHVVFEALSVGCIPLISDTTPWIDLQENNAGFVVALQDETGFVNVLENLTKSDVASIAEMRKSCVMYAKNKRLNSIHNTGYRKIFDI